MLTAAGEQPSHAASRISTGGNTSLGPDCFIKRYFDSPTARAAAERAHEGLQGRRVGKEDTGKGFASQKGLPRELLGCTLFNPIDTEDCHLH